MPARTGRVRESETLHALAHPLRVRLLEQLREPASAAELARRLRQSRQNVNYHLKELERGGLARRVGERRSGALTETFFQARADSLVVGAGGPVALTDCETAVSEEGELLPAGRWQGAVHSLHLATAAGAPVQSPSEVRAVEGRGLDGDRYFDGTGTFSGTKGTGKHVTLIELEAVRALAAERGLRLDPGAARRNVVTCGVPLNHLIGHEFRVGRAVLRGMRLCEPCTYLAGLLGRDVKAGLIHRGGLRADVVRSGTIRVGDAIQPLPAPGRP